MNAQTWNRSAMNAGAADFTITDDFAQREIIRHNLSFLGYEYWFTGDDVEYWRHTTVEHIAAMTVY